MHRYGIARLRDCRRCGIAFVQPGYVEARPFCSLRCALAVASRAALGRRFWAKVNKNGPLPPYRPELGRCWVWMGSPGTAGYGQFRVNRFNAYAHRVAWYLTQPEGTDAELVPVLCHACDTPGCVNPTHLFAGTYSDNIRDCWAKGRRLGHRAVRGEVNGQARLTEAEALEIALRARTPGETQEQIAADFGVSRSLVSRIKLGKNWTHG